MKYRPVLLLVPVLAATAAPALAGAREDMQAAFFRCAAIADDRTYLNCIYGAAQPLRAELGLPPAPASQIALVPPAPGARAPQSAGIPSGLPPVQSMAPPPRVASPIPNPAPVPSAAAPKSGSVLNRLAFGDHVDNGMVTARMTSYSFDSNHMFTITLSNKEVWRQLESDARVAHWTQPASGYKVTLMNPANGNAQLQVDDEPELYLVHRLR